MKNECSNKKFFVVQEPVKYLNYQDEKIDDKNYFKCDIENLPNHPIDMISIKNAGGINLDKYKEIQTQKSKEDALMINHKNATKKNALEVIQKYFNVSKENTISFGDDYSDIGMFENSGKKVAMGNALSTLKKMATHVTDDNDRNGIAYFINQFIL